jgi:hypothetical protein|tara:strand:- start:64 stop:645 length:582 start_codon:yes stop_codon:yes gene_type:complete
MACTALTKGRGLDCNRISGGVKKIFFSVYDEDVSYTYDGTHPLEIDAIDWNSTTIYEYVMPLGVASVTDTITGSRENGTIFYTPTVNIMLNRLTKEDQNEIKLLGATKVRIFAQLNQQLANGHDVFLALGMANGMELNAGTMDSGAAWGDRNGYTLTFDGMEAIPFAMLEDYTTNPWDQSGFINEAGTFPTTS